MNLLLIENAVYSERNKSQGDKSCYVCFKDFNRFLYNKKKQKEKNIFVSTVYTALAVKNC